MFQHFFVAVFRNLRKNKVFTFINVTGLAIGLAASLLIIQYIRFELSFDQFHRNKRDLYRVGVENELRQTKTSLLYFTVAPHLEEEIPQVDKATRLWSQKGTLSIQDEKGQRAFKEPFVYADVNFFDMFDFPLRYGEPEQVLASPQSVVLSESAAEKLFGEVSQNLLGKSLTLYDLLGSRQYQITGIAEDFPSNSHIQQDIFFSFEVIESELAKNWSIDHWAAFSTYVQLQPLVSPEDISSSLVSLKENIYPNDDGNLLLEPLTDTYLRSELGNALGGIGNAQLIQIFSLVAFFIMAIAWINYINLTTSRATERAKEVGIRKVVGSSRSHLVRQFLLEALLFNVVSAILALTLFQLSLPITSQLLGKDIQVVYLFSEPLFWLVFLAALILGSIISGLYPAFVLSAYQPVSVLKGKFSSSQRGTLLRKGLMVLQFAASIALVGSTYLVFQQLSFMRSQNLGLAIEETLIIESPAIVGDNAEDRYTSLKTELSRFPFIKSVVFSGNVPGKSYNYYVQAALPDEDLNDARSYAILEVDAQYIDEYQIPVVAGRNYSDTLSQENQRVLINEAAVLSLGFGTSQAAIGQLIKVGNSETPQEVVGIVANYHHKSLQNPYEPIIFNYRPGSGTISVKLNTTASKTSVADMINQLNDVYLALFPGNPFDYYFLDDQFNSLYQDDRRMGRLFAIFATLAVFVACLGLFGLTTSTVAQKTKEVGIRKVLGASIVSVLHLLTRDFAVLMLIAVVITLPVIFWAMQQWLTNYAFSIDYSVSLFILPIILVVLVSFLTMSTQTVRAALANPVDSLRYE